MYNWFLHSHLHIYHAVQLRFICVCICIHYFYCTLACRSYVALSILIHTAFALLFAFSSHFFKKTVLKVFWPGLSAVLHCTTFLHLDGSTKWHTTHHSVHATYNVTYCLSLLSINKIPAVYL